MIRRWQLPFVWKSSSQPIAFEFLFQGESLADFAVLDLHQLVIHVTSGVALAKDLKGLIVLASGNEVAR